MTTMSAVTIATPVALVIVRQSEQSEPTWRLGLSQEVTPILPRDGRRTCRCFSLFGSSDFTWPIRSRRRRAVPNYTEGSYAFFGVLRPLPAPTAATPLSSPK